MMARRGPLGFTLIEMLIACALLAVLSILAWRGLDTIVSSRDRIALRSDELRALTVGFAQLDDDLRRAWPVRLLELPRPWLGFSQSEAAGPMTMELMREGGGALDVSRVERVAYRLRNGVLERGFGPLLSAANADASSLPLSNVPLIWQPLVGDIVAVSFRGWRQGGGWLDGEALAIATAQVATMLNEAQKAWIAASTAASLATTAQNASGAANPAQPNQPGQPNPANNSNATANPPSNSATATNPNAGPQAQANQVYAHAREVANSLQVRGVEVTLIRTNGERYVRLFAVED